MRQSVTVLNEEVRLTETEQGYRSPDLDSKLVAKLAPGRYQALRQKGDWVEISSPKGAVWVSSRDTLNGPFEQLNGLAVAIGPDTEAYQSPTDAQPAAAKLEAQTVSGLERWHDWLLIRAVEGIFWIKEPLLVL